MYQNKKPPNRHYSRFSGFIIVRFFQPQVKLPLLLTLAFAEDDQVKHPTLQT